MVSAPHVADARLGLVALGHEAGTRVARTAGHRFGEPRMQFQWLQRHVERRAMEIAGREPRCTGHDPVRGGDEIVAGNCLQDLTQIDDQRARHHRDRNPVALGILDLEARRRPRCQDGHEAGIVMGVDAELARWGFRVADQFRQRHPLVSERGVEMVLLELQTEGEQPQEVVSECPHFREPPFQRRPETRRQLFRRPLVRPQQPQVAGQRIARPSRMVGPQIDLLAHVRAVVGGFTADRLPATEMPRTALVDTALVGLGQCEEAGCLLEGVADHFRRDAVAGDDDETDVVADVTQALRKQPPGHAPIHPNADVDDRYRRKGARVGGGWRVKAHGTDAAPAPARGQIGNGRRGPSIRPRQV